MSQAPSTSWIENPDASPIDDVNAAINRALADTGYDFAAHHAATAQAVIDRFCLWLKGGRYRAANHLLSPHVFDMTIIGPFLGFMLWSIGKDYAQHLPAFAAFDAEYRSRLAAASAEPVPFSCSAIDIRSWCEARANQAGTVPEVLK